MHHTSMAHHVPATHACGFGHSYHSNSCQTSSNFDSVLESEMNSEKAGTETVTATENSEAVEGTETEDALVSMSPEDFKNMRLLAAEMGIKPEDTYKFEEMINSLLKNGLITSQDLADAVKVNPQESGWGWNVSAEDLEAAKAKESTPVRNVLEELWSMTKNEKKTETADLPSKFEKVAKAKHFISKPFKLGSHHIAHSYVVLPQKFIPTMSMLVPSNHPHCCGASFPSGASFFANVVNTNMRGVIYVPSVHYIKHLNTNVRGVIYVPKAYFADHFKVNLDLTSGKFAAWNSSGKKINKDSPIHGVLADILEHTRHKFAKHKHHANHAHHDHNAQTPSTELSQDMEQDELLKKLFLLLEKLKNNEAKPNEEAEANEGAEVAEETGSGNVMTA